MTIKLLSLGILCFLTSSTIYSQSLVEKGSSKQKEVNQNVLIIDKDVPVHSIEAPNMEAIRLEDQSNDEKGLLYRIGVNLYTNINTSNSGLWTALPNGDKKWQLVIKSSGAEALSFIFSNFKLSGGSSFYVQNREGKLVHKKITNQDMLEDFQQNIALCFGDELILTLIDKAYANPSEFNLDRVIYNYRSTGNPGPQKIGESGTCEVNINCPEGTNYQDEKRGVARILVVSSGGSGWCSGTLINNTSQNCKPLFLTALHCGPTADVSVANMNLWKFYFNYEAVGCTNPSSVGTLANNFITGCVRLADSNDNSNGNITKSDFLLVQLGTLANEATTIATLKTPAFNAYWNGWDANTAAAASGVGIHHPAGDLKKISTFSAAPTSTTYSGSTANTHWKAQWVATTTNWGVTEGGSSGSPLFVGNSGNSRVIGTLSGGASSCGAATSSANDLYGKMSYHWTSNGTTSALSLKFHLDPTSTNLLILDGSYNPCAPAVNTPPVANFSANNTTPCIGSTVIFTDASTNTPTSWTWTFSPNTVTYVGGTSATSKNPQVQFNAVGPYTVTLNAVNTYGNNNSVKTSYITPLTGVTLPFVENFEGTTFPPTNWTTNNADGTTTAWGTDGIKALERRTAAGNTGSAAGCAGLNCFNYPDTLQVDELISIPVNLTGTTAPKITFKRAYKTYVSQNNALFFRDELKVFISTDCGATWGSALYFKKGAALASNGSINTIFTPAAVADWDTDTINLNSYIGQTIKVKFQFVNRYGNNLYLDDINIANITSALTASVSISSSDSDNSFCAGSSVTFTATAVNGGTTPTYQWKVNGVNSGTGPTFTTTTLTSGLPVTCVMTSNLSGVLGSPATSSAITSVVNPIVTPSVVISLTSGTNPSCSGTSVGFTATPTNGGTAPSYSWNVAGTGTVGNNTNSFTSSALSNNAVVSCILTSNAACLSSATGTSNSITMLVNTTPSTPTITIGSNGITLTSSSSTGNQWYKNGVLIVGAINQSYTTSSDGNYSVIVTVNSCSSTASTNTLISSASIADLSTEVLNLVIYPNPSNGKFNISYTTSDVDQVKIELQNVLGQIVYIDQLTELNGKFSKEVDFSKFGQGEYFLRVIDSKSNIVRKVVIY